MLYELMSQLTHLDVYYDFKNNPDGSKAIALYSTLDFRPETTILHLSDAISVVRRAFALCRVTGDYTESLLPGEGQQPPPVQPPVQPDQAA